MYLTVYYKRGNLSSPAGLVIDSISYNDSFFGKPPIFGDEISEEEYNNLSTYFNDPDRKYGFDGVVNDEGYAKYLEVKDSFINNGD